MKSCLPVILLFLLVGCQSNTESKITKKIFDAASGIPAQPAGGKSNIKKTTTDTTVYTSAETQPQFPGGQIGWNKFFFDHYSYGLDDGGAYVERMKVTFVIEKDGSLSNCMISDVLNKTRIWKNVTQMLQLSPKWAPAEIKGKPVRYQYEMPISCIMPNDAM